MKNKSEQLPQVGSVYYDKANERKFVIRGPLLFEKVINNPANFVFICDRPHGDGDFSYLCGLEYCRCAQ